MSLTLGGLLNIPKALSEEMERRNQLQGEAIAAKLLNKITGEKIAPNHLHFNPYVNSEDYQDNNNYENERQSSSDWANRGYRKGWK